MTVGTCPVMMVDDDDDDDDDEGEGEAEVVGRA